MSVAIFTICYNINSYNDHDSQFLGELYSYTLTTTTNHKANFGTLVSTRISIKNDFFSA